MSSFPELTREQLEELLLKQNEKVARYEAALSAISEVYETMKMNKPAAAMAMKARVVLKAVA